MGYHGPKLHLLFDDRPTQKAARKLAERVSVELADATRRFTPIGPEPEPEQAGREVTHVHLHERIYPAKVKKRGERYEAGAWTDDDKAPFVENDTRPHIIRPRADRAAAAAAEGRRVALRFPGAGGEDVFAAEVHHPGTKGAHMFAKGAAEVEHRLAEIADPVLRDMKTELERQLRGGQVRRL